MYKRLVQTVVCMVLATALASAAPVHYTYTEGCARAYGSFLALKLDEGHELISKELRNDPTNHMATYLADYEDCILLLVNCDIADYKDRAAGMDSRLKALANGDDGSPWYRFCNAGMYLHRAIINIRFGEQYKAAFNFRKSFALLRENTRLHPDFEYNDIISGLQEAVVGSLPGSYKWLASVFGMKGSVRVGTQKLDHFLKTHRKDQPLYAETMLYYLYARFYLLAEQKETWAMLSAAQFSSRGNLMNTFIKATIGLDYRKSEEVMALLGEAARDADYGKYPIFDYQHGLALLSRCDSGATFYLYRYLQHNKSDLFIKDAWQKMAYAWYVNGNMDKANYCRHQISKEGTSRIDADKQAARFATSSLWPDRALLQARLLIDGGYYDKALAILKAIRFADLKDPADRAEYYFRLGRVYEELAARPGGGSHFQQALSEYREAIKEGKNRHEQFAPRAALHMGKIYELLELDKEALASYNECLNMPPHDFQNTIDQAAKAGINRIEYKHGGPRN